MPSSGLWGPPSAVGAGEEEEWLRGQDLSNGGANKKVGDRHPKTGASISVDLAPRALSAWNGSRDWIDVGSKVPRVFEFKG